MDPFVVSINTGAQRRHRGFWTGPVGTALLILPGLVVAVLGVVLGVAYGQGASWFFAAVIALCGGYAGYAGWDHRRRVERTPANPLAFAVAEDGVAFPRRHCSWDEVRFVLTDEASPRILCSPVGLAYAVERLDRGIDDIDVALTRASSGRVRLERL